MNVSHWSIYMYVNNRFNQFFILHMFQSLCKFPHHSLNSELFIVKFVSGGQTGMLDLYLFGCVFISKLFKPIKRKTFIKKSSIYTLYDSKKINSKLQQAADDLHKTSYIHPSSLTVFY
jgi:hypothetical protein